MAFTLCCTNFITQLSIQPSYCKLNCFTKNTLNQKMINKEPQKDKLTNNPCCPTKLIRSSYEQEIILYIKPLQGKSMWLSILDSEQLNSHFEFVLFPFWQLVKFTPSHSQSLLEFLR